MIMNTGAAKTLSPKQVQEQLAILKSRFGKNKTRHPNMEWMAIQRKLEGSGDKLWSLCEMERTGGEPDVVDHDKGTDEYLFMDCSPESPAGRRSLCYDREALLSRKNLQPADNATDMAASMGIRLLSAEEYRWLQQLGKFDLKTSSWLHTPPDIRKLGGAIFGDRRYDQVFVYHNSAPSYYAARGFRGVLLI